MQQVEVKDAAYVGAGKFLLGVDVSTMRQCVLFLFGYRRSKLNSLGITRARAARLALKAIRYRVFGTGQANRVRLPITGNLAMRVHRGVKVFDFRNGIVGKVFNRNVSQSERIAEASACESVGDLAMTPQFLGRADDASWYCEELLVGQHAVPIVNNNNNGYLDYLRAAEQCLLELAGSQTPKSVPAADYIESLADFSFAERWRDAGANEQQVSRIASFLSESRDGLLRELQTQSLLLVPTHGDFSLVNTIVTSDGIRFIDWEGVEAGGPLSDIHHFLYAERYYGRINADFASALSKAVSDYRTRCRAAHPELAETLDLGAMFSMRLYCLERMRHLLKRQANQNLISVVDKTIDQFRDAETELARIDG